MGFLQSREFMASAAIAVLVMGGAVAAYSTGLLDPVTHWHSGCDAPVVTGARLDADATDTGVTRDGAHVQRTITYDLNTTLVNATMDVCTEVGDVVLRPSQGDNVRVVFHMVSEDRAGVEDAMRAADVEVAFAADGDRLSLASWQERVPRVQRLFDGYGFGVDVTIHVPAAGNHTASIVTDVGDVDVLSLGVDRLNVETDVGDVTLRDARVGRLVVTTDVGDVVGTDVDLAGNAAFTTDVGDVDVAFLGVATGTIEATTDVGDVELRLPQRADVGYDVDAFADVGDIDVDIGATESDTRDESGASEQARVRSEGYAGKVVRVAVHVVTDVGDVDVLAR